MKTLFALSFGLLLALSPPATWGQQSAQEFAREMAVDAEKQARFFAKYPDLEDERDVVAAAARQWDPRRADEVPPDDALAAEARAILSRRTPQEWQRKAVSLFPELGVAGSEFNTLFLRRHAELQRTSPQYLHEPSWPVLLARRCADELRLAAQPVAAAPVPSEKAAAAPAATTRSSGHAARLGFWPSLLSVILLLAIIIQPALWMRRCSRAFGGTDGPLTLWQRALRPAAWSYLAVALIALIRTFRANADVGFIDRFGITLLVSVLAGLAVIPLAFVVAFGVAWWLRRTASRAAIPGPATAPTLPPESAVK